MNGDDQIRRAFERVGFRDEPPMTSAVNDDVRRGQRYLRKQRVVSWASATAGVAALAAAAAFAIPAQGGDDPALDVASGGPADGSAEDSAANESGADDAAPDGSETNDSVVARENREGDGATTEPPQPLQHSFPETRGLLLQTAAEHFDPDGEHLPQETSNAQTGGGMSGGWRVGTKLDWTIPGESGMGMVQVAVSTPGYASSNEHAIADFAMSIGCDINQSCVEQAIPGTDETAWVSDAAPERHLMLSVVYERSDGSLVGIGVYDLFGNNSTEPVSEVDIDLEAALAFATDPDLQVDPQEAADESASAKAERQRHEQEQREAEANVDFSSTETVPTPDAQDLSDAEAQEAIDDCVDGVAEWEGFEPVMGVHVDPADAADVDDPADAADWAAGTYVPFTWVIAERGDTRMLCQLDSDGRSIGASLFGTAEVKDSPYLTAPVTSKSSLHFGLYTSSVARVTVQTDGGPERDAITRDGYWFLPHDAQDMVAFALRGYDESGELVYDSTKDDTECYTNPEGTEVVRPGPQENPDPQDCEPLLEWDH